MSRAPTGAGLRSAIYTGHLSHRRSGPWAHRFRHRLYVARLDLDELPALDARLRLFGHNRRRLFSLHDADYAGAAERGLRGAVEDFLAAGGAARPARIELVTQLRVLGHVFNPVSFFLCWDAAGALDSVIAEINNTYGGNHRYLLDARNRLPAAEAPRGQGHRVAKVFFVSPLIHDATHYDFHIDAAPGAPTLSIGMEVHRTTPTGLDPFFTAQLSGRRRPLSDAGLARLAALHPLMPMQIVGLIHWHALRLRLRGAPWRVPGPDHAA
jgi:uncharacterized protein